MSYDNIYKFYGENRNYIMKTMPYTKSNFKSFKEKFLLDHPYEKIDIKIIDFFYILNQILNNLNSTESLKKIVAKYLKLNEQKLSIFKKIKTSRIRAVLTVITYHYCNKHKIKTNDSDLISHNKVISDAIWLSQGCQK